MRIAHFIFLLLVSVTVMAANQREITCQVTIIGGGIAGLYSAYQLSKLSFGQKSFAVCLFEKEAEVGGRVHDVPHDKTKPQMLYGLGALRVMEGQDEVFALAKELKIELEPVPYASDLINSRGLFSFSSDELNERGYPGVPKMFINQTQSGTENHFFLLLEKHRNMAPKFFDIRSFARHVLGPQGFEFLSDVSRFRGDFYHPVDARAYLDYYVEDRKQCCVPSYPKGGMSMFATKLAEGAVKRGTRIATSSPVLSVDKQSGGFPYRVTTSNLIANSARLIIATDALSLQKIKGSVIEAVKKQQELQDIIGLPVVVINQQWPKNWWSDSGYEGKNINRAWSNESCVNFVEIPKNQYAAEQLVTRSVYSDDPSCNEFWQHLRERGGIEAVEAEIMRGLTHLFPKAEIPSPKNTIMKVWPAGWFWLKGGSKFTIEHIAEWASKPLANEAIALAGESYFIKRSGWIDGAIRSAKRALQKHFAVGANDSAP